MNVYQQIGIAILAYFVTTLIIGIREHRLKTRMKQFGNGMVCVGGIMLIVHIIMLGTILLPKMIIVILEFISAYDFEANSILVLSGLPIAFIIALLVGVSWFMYKGARFNLFKYSKEEKKFIKSENAKIRRFFNLTKEKKKE